jgi:GR25 family glycosyltransferase involved in LPS biosynthesis
MLLLFMKCTFIFVFCTGILAKNGFTSCKILQSKICESSFVNFISFLTQKEAKKNFNFKMEDSWTLASLIDDKISFTESQITRFMNRTGKFDNSILINLDEDHHRLNRTWDTLDNIRIYVERFKAFDGHNLRDSNYDLSRFAKLSENELGCLLSHLGAIYLASLHESQDSYTLIFEDNIITNIGYDGWEETLNDLRDIDSSETVHMIYFGKCMETCTQMVRVQGHIYRAVSPKCSHAYAIKNSFARRIIEDFEQCLEYPNSLTNCEYFNQPVDRIFAGYIEHGICRALVLHPNIFFQDVLNESHSGKNNPLNSYLECQDLNLPKVLPPPAPPNSRDRRSTTTIIILTIVFLVIIGILMLLIRKRKIKKSGRLLGAIVIGFLAVILYIFLRNRGAKKAPERYSLKSLLEFSVGGRHDFNSNHSLLPSHKHDLFNPNGILYKNGSGEDVLLTSTRCFDGTSSYPLLQIYNSHLQGRPTFQLQYSKMLWIESHRTMKSHHSLGYEDMRIFNYNNEIYLIGVNLDRSAKGVPGMILVKLNSVFEAVQTWHLYYPPVANEPNKNWAPIVLQNGDLGFIVNLDPLLVVKRSLGSYNEYLEKCEVVYESPKQTNIDHVRNSSITISWNDIPLSFRVILDKISPMDSACQRFVLMGHTKYISYGLHGMEVLYQHYFVIVDLPRNSEDYDTGRVYYSTPFHVEEEYSPHIEYISGFSFVQEQKGDDTSWLMVMMYGLRDIQSSHINLRPEELDKFLKAV